MWELDCEEGWAPRNWCFWSVVLEKTLESLLDCEEIHSEVDQPWDFFGRNDAKPETPVLWPPHAKSWLFGKDSDAGRDWVQEEKRTTEDEMAGWHHWLDGHESEWTLGVGDGQGDLLCCDSWGHQKLNMTEWLIWSESQNDSLTHGLENDALWTGIWTTLNTLFISTRALGWLSALSMNNNILKLFVWLVFLSRFKIFSKPYCELMCCPTSLLLY